MRPIVTGGVAWSVCDDHEPCKNNWTDPDAVWVVDSGGSKEACIRWGAHWRHLANMIKPSMCSCDVAFFSNYFGHLLRPHCSTMYIDGPVVIDVWSSMVCRSVTLVSPAKMAAPITMPFGLRTRVGPRNHVFDGGPDPSMGRSNFEGGRGVQL